MKLEQEIFGDASRFFVASSLVCIQCAGSCALSHCQVIKAVIATNNLHARAHGNYVLRSPAFVAADLQGDPVTGDPKTGAICIRPSAGKTRRAFDDFVSRLLRRRECRESLCLSLSRKIHVAIIGDFAPARESKKYTGLRVYFYLFSSLTFIHPSLFLTPRVNGVVRS